MARPGFSLDRKFKRLARALDDVQAGFGEILARGSLELLWDSAYEACDDYLGDADDVEALAHWGGKAGTLTAALLAAGGEDRAGFIEEGGSKHWQEGKPGTFRVHDLYDHAPDYVQKRLAREAQREAKGQSITDLRRAAGKKGAATTHGKRTATVGQPDGNRRATGGRLPVDAEQVSTAGVANSGGCPASVWQIARTPSPAPAPAPTLPEAAAAAESKPDAQAPGEAGHHERGSSPDSARGAGAVPTRAAPAPTDDTPPRRLEVIDESGDRPQEHPMHPLTDQFRHALADSLARTAPHPVGGGRGGDLAVFDACERALERLGVEPAVQACRQRVLDAVARRERQPQTLKFFVDAVLGDLLTARSTEPPKRKRVIGMNEQTGEVQYAEEP